MPVYEPLTDIVPSPATGVAVPAAWGDQVDDNLVHHYEGTWFRAIGGATTLSAGVYTTIPMTSIVISDTATDEGTISIASGAVSVTRTGVWMLFGCVQYAASNMQSGLALFVSGTQVTEAMLDSTGSNSVHATSAIVIASDATTTFTMQAYIQSTSPAVTVNNFSPRLSGVWLGSCALPDLEAPLLMFTRQQQRRRPPVYTYYEQPAKPNGP